MGMAVALVAMGIYTIFARSAKGRGGHTFWREITATRIAALTWAKEKQINENQLPCNGGWFYLTREYTIMGLLAMRIRRSIHFGTDQINRFDCMADVWDGDAAPYDQSHIQCIGQFSFLPACLDALDQVVIDAVIAAQDGRSHQPEELLCFRIQCTILIRGGIQVEKPLDTQVVDLPDPVIHPGAIAAKFVQARRHVSSRSVGVG